MFRYTQIITFILSALMYFSVGRENLILAFAFYFLINFFCDMQMPVFWSSIAEAVDYGEKKTGLRVSGLAFGGILFFQKFGMGIAGGILGFLLSHFGYQADVEQSARSLTGIALMMTLIPALFHLAVGLLMKKYLINNEYYRDIQLASRRSRHKEAQMKAMNKVWVIGDASVDLVPEKQNSYLKCPGGASANVGYALPSWAESAVLSVVLVMMTPAVFCAGFQDNGVDVTFLRLDAALTSAVLIVNLTADGERSFTYLVHRCRYLRFAAGPAAVQAARMVLLQLNWPHRQARSRGVP